uniref:Uncharacterized protein n=1 Tax=Rhizophora mucronata TaxID=61149 RepID=A0A2P2NM83_RHIMU
MSTLFHHNKKLNLILLCTNDNMQVSQQIQMKCKYRTWH